MNLLVGRIRKICVNTASITADQTIIRGDDRRRKVLIPLCKCAVHCGAETRAHARTEVLGERGNLSYTRPLWGAVLQITNSTEFT